MLKLLEGSKMGLETAGDLSAVDSVQEGQRQLHPGRAPHSLNSSSPRSECSPAEESGEPPHLPGGLFTSTTPPPNAHSGTQVIPRRLVATTMPPSPSPQDLDSPQESRPEPAAGNVPGSRKRTRRACDKCSSFRVRCDGGHPW